MTCLALLLLAGLSHARTTTRWDDAGVLVDRWTTEDGLPLDHVIDAAVSPAGLVWLATLDGLVRFDGDEFRTWRRSDLPDLPSNRLVSVAVDASERPWFVTETFELVRLDHGRVNVWPFPGTSAVHGAVTAAGGSMWLLGRTGGLARLTDEGPVVLPGMPADATPLSIAEVGGELWVGTVERGAWVIGADDVARPIPGTADILYIRTSVADPRGGAWLVSDDGLWHAGRDGVRPAVPERAGIATCSAEWTDRLTVVDEQGAWSWDGRTIEVLPGRGISRRLCWSSGQVIDGRLWRVVEGGLALGTGHPFGLDTAVRKIVAGPDRAVWVATNGVGLLRLRPPTIDAIRPDLGNTPAVLAAPDGTIWTRRWDGQPVHLSVDGETLPAPANLTTPDSWVFPGMTTDRAGRVWLSAWGQVCAVVGLGCVRVAPLAPADADAGRAFLAASDGRMWMGTEHGVAVMDAAGSRWERPDAPDPLSRAIVSAMAEGEAGAVWIATRDEGLFRHAADGWRRWTRGEGLSSNKLRAVWPAPDGVVWIGTEDAGLCRLDPATGAVACLGKHEGLFDDVVHTIFPDDQGRVWMSSNRGIFWVRRAQLEDYAAGRRSDVLSLGYAVADGMAHREANGGFGPAGARDQAGRLWFPTQAGLARVDPRRAPMPEPPQVLLDEVTVAGEPRVGFDEGRLVLSPQERELSVRWTTGVGAWADQVRFRHRLVGLDDTWSAPTSAREARWTSLPPGDLTLEIQAALAGDWGPATTLELRRRPAFVETRAFPASLGFGGLALGGLFAAWRGVRSRRRQAELEAVVRARTSDLAASNQALEAQAALLTAASARLAEVDAMRTRLIADLSHELRTPLTLIAGPLEDLAAAPDIPEGPSRRRLDVVLNNARRLEELVDQLLDVARLESGKILLRVRRRDLGELLRTVAARFEPEYRRKGLRLELTLAQAPADLYVDADLLDKVVSNLLSNALKFTPAGGAVTVRLLASPDEEAPVRVEVRDTGVGVPEALRDRLFDRFVQGESGDARRFEGVGIGLALARDLVHLHGGEIGLTSEVGVGSTFWLTLPRGVDHLAPEDIASGPDEAARVVIPREPASMPLPPEGEAERPAVLVVEDHPEMRDFLVAHLRKRFSVTAAASGAEALDLVRTSPPAAVMSDVMMPGMDGLELCRRLRADPSTAAIPILLASAKAGEDDRVAGLAVADDYVTKPLRMRELVSRLEKLVARGAGAGPAGEGVAEAAAGPTDELGPADLQLRARIEAAVAANLADQAFGVEELARAVALSRRQLLREVVRVTGLSPSDLLRARRMEAGHRLLEAGEVSTVAEAAARVGLSAPYFSRTYTAWYKRAPSELLQRGHA